MVVKRLWGEQFVDSDVLDSDVTDGDEIPTTDDRIRQLTYISAAVVANEVVAFRNSYRSE